MLKELPEVFTQEKSVIPWLGKTGKLLSVYMRLFFSKHGIDLTREQAVLLALLHHKDGQMQKDLAFITERNKGSLARLINTMERKNYVARIPSNDDKRVNQIYLTKHGKSVFEKLKPVLDECLEKAQEGLTEEEIKITISVLKKIQHNIARI